MAKTRWARDYTRDIIDAKKRFDDVKEHIKEPPEGQVPVGDWGIYTSPNLQSNEPVSPFDCDQYPDSPYCGGTPWTKTPVGLEPEWGFNECGAWVQLNPVIGFTKLPPVSVGWRRPGKCRQEEKPPPPPEQTDTSRPVSPVRFPKNIPPEATVFVVLILKYKFESVYDSDLISTDPGTTTIVTTEALTSKRYPVVNALVPAYLPYGGMVPAIAIADAVIKESVTVLRQNTIDFRESIKNAKTWISSDQRPPQEPNFKRYTVRNLTGNYRITGFLPSGWNDANQSRGVIMYGNFAEIAADWEGYVVDSTSFFNAGQTIYIHKEEYEIAYISIPDSDKYPPPPDQRKKKRCCMQCCSGGNQQSNKQDQDLSEIKKMLKEIKKRLGTDEYPVPMPESLNVSYNDKGKRSEPKMIKEENLTGVVGRFIRYFDGIVGEFGLGFKVADADPTKPGDQPKFITANNISELLEEMYSHIFDMWIMQYQFLQLDQRHAIESMLARKVGIQNYYLLQAITDWCGFKTKDITKKVPFLFDIDAEGFENFLKNKEQEIQVPDFDPDDQGSDSFPDHLLRLKRAAAIIEAVHTSKFKNSDDIPKKIMEMLVSTGKNIDRVNSDELKAPGSREDFDQWLRDAETAFINRVGTGDVTNPYGVPYAQRPRLTKIADTESTGEET